jgi:cytochrome c oxidase cbb3-type subunit I
MADDSQSPSTSSSGPPDWSDTLHRRFGTGYESVTGVNELRFRHTDRAARLWILSSAFWFVVVTTIGMIIATELVSPEVFGGIGWMVFPRMRTAHILFVVYAWLTMMYWGFILFMTPRLLGTRDLWHERWSYWSGWVYNVVLVFALINLLVFTHTTGREWNEFTWPVTAVILAVFAVNILNIVGTVNIRRVRPLYVSIWWAMMAPVWVAVSIFISHVMWKPGNLWQGTPGSALTNGIHDAMLNWWGNHNLFGLWLTPILICAVYYFVPRITNTPLYSHTLSLFSFWGLVFFYTTVGDHHILQSPTPGWLKTIATINSIGILVSAVAFFSNIWLTMRGQWNKFMTSLPLRFAIVGFLFYIFSNIQGSLMAVQPFNLVIHFTFFVIGHSHLALLGGFTILGMGVLNYVVPIVLNKPMYSRTLGEFQFWCVFIGFLFFLLSLTVAGFLQGQNWINGVPEVIVLPQLLLWNIMRAVSGGLVYTAAWIQLVNVLLTVFVDTRAREARIMVKDAGSALATTPRAVGAPAR